MERKDTRDYLKFYVDGQWIGPAVAKSIDVINPATEKSAGRISMGSAVDVDRAVLPPSCSAELSAWKNFGDLIEIGNASQRFTCELDNKGTIAAAFCAGDSRSARSKLRACGPHSLSAAIQLVLDGEWLIDHGSVAAMKSERTEVKVESISVRR